MLDIHMFRDNHEKIRADHDKRGISHEKIDQVIHFDSYGLVCSIKPVSYTHLTLPTMRTV